MYVFIRYIRPGRQAHANLEDSLADTIDVSRGIFIDGLLVHGLPHGTGLDLHGIEPRYDRGQVRVIFLRTVLFPYLFP